jgi:hypothetical protein
LTLGLNSSCLDYSPLSSDLSCLVLLDRSCECTLSIRSISGVAGVSAKQPSKCSRTPWFLPDRGLYRLSVRTEVERYGGWLFLQCVEVHRTQRRRKGRRQDAMEFTHSPLDIAGHRDGLLDATLLVLLYLRLALLLSISCGLPRGCFGCPTLGGQLSLNVR